MNQFQVAVKTHNDAHFALSGSPHDSAEMVEIVLGGRQNTRSWVSVGKMGEPLVSAATPGILSWDEFRSFWISWKGGVVQVGNEEETKRREENVVASDGFGFNCLCYHGTTVGKLQQRIRGKSLHFQL